MRNWNDEKKFEIYNLFSSPFLRYLWGIETQATAYIVRLPEKFLRYLWGIETLHSKGQLVALLLSFYATYEELKQNKKFGRFEMKVFSFYATYEELKLTTITISKTV